jgi:hypothetical protein
LSYIGKPFSILKEGRPSRVFGWQGLRMVRYPELGWRLFGYCDIPDLDLFPSRYPDLRNLEFVAGHEVKLLHLGTWILSWMVRIGLVKSLDRYAAQLLGLSFLFDALGSDKSGFHMFLGGYDADGNAMRISIFMIARQIHGPNIPCVPAILLARRIAAGEAPAPGARPCLDLVDLDEYLSAIAHLDVTTIATGPNFTESWPAAARAAFEQAEN